MNFKETAEDIINDLLKISASTPNERLPKEEQIRSRTYASLSSTYDTICVERGYASVDDGSFIECDLWARKETGEDVWVEIKRCWNSTGFNNKPNYQLASWKKDIAKLAKAPISSKKVFILTGLFDDHPSSAVSNNPPRLLELINNFFPKNLCHNISREFEWRESPITHIGVWIWEWSPHTTIDLYQL